MALVAGPLSLSPFRHLVIVCMAFHRQSNNETSEATCWGRTRYSLRRFFIGAPPSINPAPQENTVVVEEIPQWAR